MKSAGQIKLGIHKRMRAGGFKYFLIDGDLFGWFSDFLAINDRGETWEICIIDSMEALNKFIRSKGNRLKSCRNLSPGRIPNFSSIVCPFDLIKPTDIPDYSGLFYLAGSDKLTAFKNMRQIKHAERLSNELMSEEEWFWVLEQSQNDYINRLWA